MAFLSAAKILAQACKAGLDRDGIRNVFGTIFDQLNNDQIEIVISLGEQIKRKKYLDGKRNDEPFTDESKRKDESFASQYDRRDALRSENPSLESIVHSRFKNNGAETAATVDKLPSRDQHNGKGKPTRLEKPITENVGQEQKETTTKKKRRMSMHPFFELEEYEDEDDMFTATPKYSSREQLNCKVTKMGKPVTENGDPDHKEIATKKKRRMSMHPFFELEDYEDENMFRVSPPPTKSQTYKEMGFHNPRSRRDVSAQKRWDKEANSKSRKLEKGCDEHVERVLRQPRTFSSPPRSQHFEERNVSETWSIDGSVQDRFGKPVPNPSVNEFEVQINCEHPDQMEQHMSIQINFERR